MYTLAPEARCLKNKNEQITEPAAIKRRETGLWSDE